MKCAEKAGFLIPRPCRTEATVQCPQCQKWVCGDHTATMPHGGLACTSCAAEQNVGPGVQRRQIYDALRSSTRERYDRLATEIDALQQEFRRDPRLNAEIFRQRSERLSNLAWTYLRLLHTGEMLDRFIETEDPADLERKITTMEKELAAIGGGSKGWWGTGGGGRVARAQAVRRLRIKRSWPRRCFRLR